MRGGGGMGFINRGSSLGTGIDYGTFTGAGAGGARFYGEGVVNLKRGGGTTRTQFMCRITRNGTSLSAVISSGCINNILVLGNTLIISQDHLVVVLEAQTSSGNVTGGSLTNALRTDDLKQTPSAGFPPTTVKIPLWYLEKNEDDVVLQRLYGSSGIDIFPKMTGLQSTNSAVAPFSPLYVWAVLG